MPDDVVFYPPDLPLELAQIVESAHTLDLWRQGRNKKLIGRVHLTTEGSPTPHGKRPDKTDEQLASEVFEACERDAKAKCKGHATYKIVATYSKPTRGTTADPRSFEIEVGDPSERSETERRGDVIEALRVQNSDKHREYLELAREVTNLAKAVGTMATGLASAWSNVHAQQAETQSASLDRLVLQQQREGERDRMRLLEKSVLPMLGSLQRSFVGGRAPKALAEAKPDNELRPEIVRLCRSLGESLTRAQLEHAAKTLSGDRLGELASVESEPDALALVAWLIEHDTSAVMDVYAGLREDQMPIVDRLQQLAMAAGEKHAAAS